MEEIGGTDLPLCERNRVMPDPTQYFSASRFSSFVETLFGVIEFRGPWTAWQGGRM